MTTGGDPGQACLVPSRLDRWSRSAVWPALAKWMGLAVLGLIYFALCWLAVMSVSADPLSGIPYPLTLANYRALAADTRWLPPLEASIAVGFVVGACTALAATVVGRALPRSRRSGLLTLFAVLPLFIPGMSLGAAMFIALRSALGLDLGVWSLVLGHFVWAFPFALLTVLVLTSRFDHRLVEAAADLGASRWRCFRDIEFPLLRPAILGAGIFGFLISFNETQRSLFLRGSATTLPVWNWIMASSEQSQVATIFCLETLILAAALPLLSAAFWLLFTRTR